jgi:hypothetical protein
MKAGDREPAETRFLLFTCRGENTVNSLSLGTLAVLSFFMGCIGFLFMVWRVSWAVSGFVHTQERRAAIEEQIVNTLLAFVHKQGRTNEELWDAAQVQADRLNRLVEQKSVETN